MSRLYDSIEEALAHLAGEPAGRDIAVARRYLGNALEQLQCMICHKEMLTPERTRENAFYKGYAHRECVATYGSRMEYENWNSDEPWAVQRRQELKEEGEHGPNPNRS